MKLGGIGSRQSANGQRISTSTTAPYRYASLRPSSEVINHSAVIILRPLAVIVLDRQPFAISRLSAVTGSAFLRPYYKI